jgi:integrase
VKFAALSGWRRQEIQQLTWEEIDLEGGVIRLSPERSKNDDGRVLPIVGPIAEVIERRVALRAECPLPYVFWRAVGSRRERKTAVRYLPLGDWRKAWTTACKAAGCEGRILHDFRRTVARNLRRAGVSTIDAMAWTGHKTDSMFKRYSIVSEDDVRATGEKFAAYLKGEQR